MQRSDAVRDMVAEGSGLLRDARQAIDRLVLFRGVLDDPVGRTFVALLDHATARGTSATAISQAYGHLLAQLADAVELGHGPLVGDAWQDHLLAAILRDDNPFSRKARYPAAPMGQALVEIARRDLVALQVLHQIEAHALTRALSALDPDALSSALVPWDAFEPLNQVRPAATLTPRRHLATAPRWEDEVAWLADYYARTETGLFAGYRPWSPYSLSKALMVDDLPVPRSP
jgi:hypothetical protein